MNKFKEFFRSKAFYIAFGTGILAFSGLLLVYNYSDNRQGLKKEQAIDLNQPAQITEEEFAPAESDGVLTGDDIDANGVYGTYVDEEILATDTTEEIEESDSEAVATVSDAKEETEPEDTVSVASSYTDTTEDVAANYSYDGEQSLAWPLNGDVILPYSMDTTVYFATLKSYKCNPGMLIAGSEGTKVVSAYDGVVESIVEDKEHGTMVNVNMGNGYVTSYGQLMNVSVAEGDEVVLGQPLGEIAPVTAYYTEEGTHLYFQMTKDGEVVNPIIYIQ